MEKVKIQFQTPQDLTGFRKVVKAPILELNIAESFIVAQCSKEEIVIAINNFEGKITETLKEKQ